MSQTTTDDAQTDDLQLEEPALPEDQADGGHPSGVEDGEPLPPIPDDYGHDGALSDTERADAWARAHGYDSWDDAVAAGVAEPRGRAGHLPGDLTGDDLTRPVNRGTRNGRGEGSTATPESKHGQVAGGGGGGKGGLPRKRMLGEPRKRRTSGGGGGGFTLFGSLINLRIGGGGIHLASGNQVGPKQIGGRPRGGSAARVARRRRRT